MPGDPGTAHPRRVPPRRRFRDRTDAGRALAGKLGRYASAGDVLVLALPRGGVPVAFEVARAIGAPLDLMFVRRLPTPGYDEYAMGAIASGGVRVLNRDVIAYLRIPAATIEQVAAAEWPELERRERELRGDRPPPDVVGRTILLVDDGLCTGATLRAAAAALRQQGAGRVVAAVPVAWRYSVEQVGGEFDELVSVVTRKRFGTVGRWYDDFTPTTDEEVRDLLARNTARP